MVPPSSSSKRKEPPEPSSSVPRPYSKTAAKEDRRKRGEIACAECRRLKVRCDRQIPCSTCISRGCTALCPNGLLPPGDNSRFVAKSKDHLETKLAKIEERMRALEDALAIAQAAETSEPHPLLATSWRMDEEDTEPCREDGKEKESTHADDLLADTFGTLHVDEKHRTVRFFGPAGGAESLLIDKEKSVKAADSAVPEEPPATDFRALGIPPELDVFYHAFPLAPPIGVPRTHVRATIESCLPSPERADRLCRLCLTHMSWMFQIATYQQLTQDLMPAFYRRADRLDVATGEDGPHDLALLLIVFAVGALVDLSLPAYNAEAQRYHILARAALALQPLVEKASLNTVKTLHLISIFNGMSGKESNMANTYTVLNLAGRIAQRIGLHVDPANWNLSEKEIYARRIYFYNLFQGDMIQCLGTGRPPALATVPYTVKIPTEEEERAYQENEMAPIGFGIWIFRFDVECVLPVVRILMNASPPSYQEVLDVEKRMDGFKVATQIEEETPCPPDVASSMRRWVRLHFVDILLLSLHRAFFAQAIALNPVNPLDTPYSHSFLTAYRSACHVIQLTSDQFTRHPQLLARVWMVWSLNYMSALIIGVVASKTKGLPLSPTPFIEFERACELFQNASATNSRAAAALPILLGLREKAVQLHSSPARPGPLSQGAADPLPLSEDLKFLRPSPSAEPTFLPPSTPQSGELLVPPYTPLQYSPSPVGSEPPSQPAYYWQSDSYAQDAQYTQPYADSTPDGGALPARYITPPQAGLTQWVPPVSAPALVSDSMLPQAAPVNFILGDTWSTFMEHYGRLPQ